MQVRTWRETGGSDRGNGGGVCLASGVLEEAWLARGCLEFGCVRWRRHRLRCIDAVEVERLAEGGDCPFGCVWRWMRVISGGFDWGGLRRGKGRWLCQSDRQSWDCSHAPWIGSSVSWLLDSNNPGRKLPRRRRRDVIEAELPEVPANARCEPANGKCR